MSKYIGDVSAYAYAVSKGYTGTEEEFAELMASYATVGQTAVDAKDAAVAAKTAAQTAATTATNKASEATTAAQTATTKAGEASTSASQASTSAQTASTKASEASQSASTASEKATEATTAAGTATTAKNDAQAAKTAAETAQGKAETAQEAAEDAAESVSASAAQIAQNTSDISDVKNDLNDIQTVVFINPPYGLAVDNFEYGGISVSSANGYTYSSSGRHVRTKQDYYVNLNAGDVLSIGDGSVNLTLVSDGSTVTKTIELFAAWYNPATNKYEQRTAQTADFTAPIDGDYVLNIRLTDYNTHFLTIYTDAIEKFVERIKVIPKDFGNISEKLNDSLRYLTKNQNCLFAAHQGYADDMLHNNCRLQGYVDAFYHGFDWGEVDIKQTSDGYLVCSHDNTFEDATSGETVTIANSTLAELQAHNYYGTKIATLDEVIYTCKMLGLGLFIDQLSTAEIIHKAFTIVRHYGMLDRVGWSIPYGYPAVNTIVMSEYDKSIVSTTSAANTVDEIITFAESIATGGNLVYAYLPYNAVTANGLQTIAESLPSNIRLGIWAPNTVELIKPLLPYVEAVTSDKVSYYDIFKTLRR